MKVRMFRVNCGKEIDISEFDCMSDTHAVTICVRRKEKYGLIGRYYCETSNGYNFKV